jgi:hypothetical protein
MNSHQQGRKLLRVSKNAIAAGVIAAASKTGELWFAHVNGTDELTGIMTDGDIGVDE